MVTLNHPARQQATATDVISPIRVSKKWVAQILTFLMVFGPGLIVMEADNDAGAVSTYVRAGAEYSTHLLWLLLLLLPITYFVQEMVVRLGIATGQGFLRRNEMTLTTEFEEIRRRSRPFLGRASVG